MVSRLALAVLALCASVAAASVTWDSSADAKNSIFTAYYGEETCISLAVNTDGTGSISALAEAVSGSYPYTGSNAMFAYPYDDVNYPSTGAFGNATTTDNGDGTDLYAVQYCFTPAAGEECAYSVCFQGADGAGGTTGVRCYKLETENTALYFAGAGSVAFDDDVSALITPAGGFAVSGWVYPECDASAAARNVSVLAFGSDRDEATAQGVNDAGLAVRNSVVWHEDEDDKGSFFYDDCYIGAVFTADRFCCDTWHFVALSVAEDGAGTLHVDGVASDAPSLVGSLDKNKADTITFSTDARPDNNLDGDAKGTFTMGDGLTGFMDEVYVFDAALTDAEAEALFSARSAPSAVKSYTMRGAGLPNTTVVTAVDTPYPGAVPCVLGLEHSVGPSDGGCPSAVYGWGFAPGPNPKVKFGTKEARATYVDATTVLVETPGASPRFVDVVASNDGVTFTDPALVGRDTKHLYMESSLYLTGQGDGGASADSVCMDLPTKAVTFGAWVCPKCGPAVPDSDK